MVYSPVAIRSASWSESGARVPVVSFGRSRREAAWRVFTRAVGSLFAGFLLSSFALVLFAFDMGIILSHVNPPITSIMIRRHLVDHIAVKPIEFIPIQKIPLHVQQMFIRLEDSHFYEEPGIDVAAMVHAYVVNREYGKIVLGGSTITQQLVRTLFLTNHRTYVRKYAEVLMAIALNSVMPKQRQLELYLNSIEWGKGVFGIGAAAHYYYGRSLAKLDLDQAIRLAVVISSPVHYGVYTFVRNPGMVQRYDFLWSLQ